MEDFIEIYDETKASHQDYWLDRIEEQEETKKEITL